MSESVARRIEYAAGVMREYRSRRIGICPCSERRPVWMSMKVSTMSDVTSAFFHDPDVREMIMTKKRTIWFE